MYSGDKFLHVLRNIAEIVAFQTLANVDHKFQINIFQQLR